MTVPERLFVSACQSASVRGSGSGRRASVASAAPPSGAAPPEPPVPVAEPSRAAPPEPPVPVAEPSLATCPEPPLPPDPAVEDDSTPSPHAVTRAVVAPPVISRNRRRSTRAVNFNIGGASHFRDHARGINRTETIRVLDGVDNASEYVRIIIEQRTFRCIASKSFNHGRGERTRCLMCNNDRARDVHAPKEKRAARRCCLDCSRDGRCEYSSSHAARLALSREDILAQRDAGCRDDPSGPRRT
jgi:hypothetical protein